MSLAFLSLGAGVIPLSWHGERGPYGAAAIHRNLEIDDHGLLDAPFPFDKADDALDFEAAQKK